MCLCELNWKPGAGPAVIIWEHGLQSYLYKITVLFQQVLIIPQFVMSCDYNCLVFFGVRRGSGGLPKLRRDLSLALPQSPEDRVKLWNVRFCCDAWPDFITLHKGKGTPSIWPVIDFWDLRLVCSALYTHPKWSFPFTLSFVLVLL